MQKITPFLWFDDNAEEAAKFYTSIFKNSKVGSIAHYDESMAKAAGRKVGSVMTVDFNLAGQEFTAINGGPIFKLNQSISFFAYGTSEKEVDELYKKLSPGGKVYMALDKYPFSERYAFFSDKYGLSWQVMLSKEKKPITPCLLFVGKNVGNAKKAIEFYTSIFKNSKINHMALYEKEEFGNKKGTVKHASFVLEGEEFTAMDGAGPHAFAFNEAISFTVRCETQKELDDYWGKLTQGGGIEAPCGWLKDKYGVSWQITPAILIDVAGKEAKKVAAMRKAMLKMSKLDIALLKKAYDAA